MATKARENHREDVAGRANVEDTPELLAYYEQLERLEAGALWTVANKIAPWQPKSSSVPVLWRYEDLRAHVLRSVELVSPEKAGRRVIYLNNPGRREHAAVVGYAPFGPCIVTADEITDPHALDLWLTVNGVEKQRSNTRHMLFKVPLLIADISAAMTLEPGDIIATGTPEGVGAGRSPQEWLWPGDVVEAEVTGIGRLRHPVVAI